MPAELPPTAVITRPLDLHPGRHARAIGLAFALLCSGGAGCDYRLVLGDEPVDAADSTQAAPALVQADDGASPASSDPTPQPASASSGSSQPVAASDPSPKARTTAGAAASTAQPGGASGATNPSVDDGCGVAESNQPCGDDPDPCALDSGFEGDEYCLLPPAPGEGVQIHFGPRAYRDADDVADYLVEPNTEFLRSQLAHIPLDNPDWWDRIQVQARPGVHHWMAKAVDGRPEEGIHVGAGCDDAAVVGALARGGNLVFDSLAQGKPAPENEGLGYPIAPDDSLCLSVHHYNFGNTPHLVEVWINLHFPDDAEVTQEAGTVALVGGLGLSLPPNESVELNYSVPATGAGRIISLFGEHNGHTRRMAVWLNDSLVYDSYDPYPPRFVYDSITVNPPLENGLDGAPNGPVSFDVGDELKVICSITNNTSVPLRFGTSWGVIEGEESCNLWGHTVGASFGGMFQ